MVEHYLNDPENIKPWDDDVDILIIMIRGK